MNFEPRETTTPFASIASEKLYSEGIDRIHLFQNLFPKSVIPCPEMVFFCRSLKVSDIHHSYILFCFERATTIPLQYIQLRGWFPLRVETHLALRL